MTITLPIIIMIVITGLIVVALVAKFMLKKRKRRNYPAKAHQKWLDVQRLCASKDTWALAVINADKLLEEALKKTKYKGKSIGERLVAAQRKISDNDGVWYAHNLAKKLVKDRSKKLREAEVKKALVGFRQALRDLGVLNGKS